MRDDSVVRAACQAFVAAAFEVLTEEHVLPAPIHNAHLAVGRDYFGDSVRPLAEFRTVEARLNKAYPERFADPRSRDDAEFASMYAFSLLEGCIVRCAQAQDFTPTGSAVTRSIDELLRVLDARGYELVCARHVAHLTTSTAESVEIDGITVVPEPEGFGGLVERICRKIPAAPRAWNREDPRPYDPPHALLIVRETTDDSDPHAVHARLAGRVDRFLLLTRLLSAGTAQSVHEICGTTTLVSRMAPHARTFGEGWSTRPLVRRTVRLTGDEGPAFAALGRVMDTTESKREGTLVASFDVALAKYNRSYTTASAFEHLVDLATALEGVLIGAENEGEGLTLRLCSRTAALLADDADPGTVIFNDVKTLYTLRSKLVHGGQITQKELAKHLRNLSAVPEETRSRFGLALAYAVDRMRDLVRRAILARLCLAGSTEPLWPFVGGTPVDAILADDRQRHMWREHWHTRLAELGAGDAADRSRPPVATMSQEDR